jgi:hypothetical protein
MSAARSEIRDGMQIEWEAAILVDDGIVLRADVFRPVGNGKFPYAASNQALTGTNRVFYARLDGNKMTLKSPTLVVGTSGVTSVVEIEYVKAE